MKPEITESVIDDVLARLFIENERAVETCLSAVAAPDSVFPFDRTTVSRQVPHLGARGTSDLMLHVWSGDELKALILVENKIDAGFTADQPARYALCRDKHIAALSAPFVATLLISPAIYIEGSRMKDEFDGVLSYESLRPHLGHADMAFVELAIERASSPYEPAPVEAVMSFFDGYAAIAAEVAPDLKIKNNPNSANARPAASRTIYYNSRASGFRSYPFLLKGDKHASIRVSHQCWDSAAPSASVKLMLDGWARHIPVVCPILRPKFNGTGLYLRAAGRSMALVADTQQLDNFSSADSQRAAIEDALAKLQHVRETWNDLGADLAHAAAIVKQCAGARS